MGFRRLNERSWARIAIVAIVFGALVRVLWVLVIHPPYNAVYSDMAGYVERAVRVASGVTPDRYDAFYPPGPHLLLSLPLILVGTGKTGLWLGAVLWAALSSLTPYALWRLSRVLLSAPAAALAAVFEAVYPLHIIYSGYFLSETPALAFLLLSLWCGYEAARGSDERLVRRFALAAGAFGGLAFMCRPQSILNLAILAVPLLRATRARVMVPLAAGFLVLFAVQLGYNSVAAGRFTPTSENGGVTFFLGHCDVNMLAANDGALLAWTFGSPVAVQRGGGRNYVFDGEAVWEQAFYYGRGLDCIRADGVGHLRLMLRSVVDMGASTVPWPPSQEPWLREVAQVTNTLFTITLIPIVASAVLLIRRRRPDASGVRTLLWQLAMVVPLAVVFFGDPRFRVVYDSFALAILGAVVADARASEPRSTPSDGEGFDSLRANSRPHDEFANIDTHLA